MLSCPVRDGAYKRFLAVNWNIVAALAFLSLFEWSFAMHLMPYNHKYNVLSALCFFLIFSWPLFI